MWWKHSDSTSSSSETVNINHKVLLAHAVCGALTALLFIPTTILLPRLARGFSLNRWWFPVHVTVASGALLGGLVTLGIAKVGLGDAGSHGALGSTLLGLLLAQVALGTGMKWYNHKHPRHPSRGRNPLNWVHVALGLTVTAVGWATVYTGWAEQWPRVSGTGGIAGTLKILYWVVVALVVAVYTFGWILFWPEQRRMELAAAMQAHSGSTNELPLMGGPQAYKAIPEESQRERYLGAM